MNSTCFYIFSILSTYFYIFAFFGFLKLENVLQVQLFFHFVVDNHRAMMGWSWADNRRSYETWSDSKKNERFKKSWPLRGSRKYQIVSVFRNEQHIFQNNIYRLFCSDNHKKANFAFEIKLFDVKPDDTML